MTKHSIYISFIARSLGMLLSYCTLLLLTHLLTKNEFASYVLVVTYSNLLMLVGTLGAHEVLKYERAHGFNTDSVVNGTIFRYVFRISIYLGSALFLILFVGIIFTDLESVYVLIAIVIVPNIMLEVFNARKIADGQVLESIFLYYIGRNFLLLLLLLVCQNLYEVDVFVAMFCNIIAMYVVHLFYTLQYWNNICERRYVSYWSLNWQHGMRNIVLVGVSTLMLSVDIIMLGIFSKPADVADYNFATRLVQLPVLLLIAMNPRIISYIVNNIKCLCSHDFTSFITKNTTMAFLFFVFVVVIMLGGWEYIFYVANNQYSNTISLFWILSIYKLFEVLASWKGTAINILGLSSWVMKIAFYVLIFNIFLNFFLIPIYHATGAAVATSISFAIYYSLLIFKYERERIKNTVYQEEKE